MKTEVSEDGKKGKINSETVSHKQSEDDDISYKVKLIQ